MNYLLNKPLLELESVIEDRQPVYAHTGKQGTMKLWKSAPGKYHYLFEYLRAEVGWDTSESDNDTLSSFLESISVEGFEQAKDYAQEMKDALSLPIWSTIDEYEYHTMQEYDERANERGRAYADLCEESGGSNISLFLSKKQKGWMGEVGPIAAPLETEAKYSALSTLKDLESVINTGTPVWDIGIGGDYRVKLDTDANGRQWYVFTNGSSQGGEIKGTVSCWAFPHFNGAYDAYSYVPQKYCFATFADLFEDLFAHFDDGDRAVWAYDEEEYKRRLEMNQGEPYELSDHPF